MKKWIGIGIFVFLLAGLGVYFKFFKERNNPMYSEEEELPPLEAKGMIVDRGDVVQWTMGIGTVVSGRTREFYSPINTVVKKVFVKLGERVKKGQRIVLLECERERAEYENALFEYKKALARYKYLKNHSEDTLFLRVKSGLSEAEKRYIEAKRTMENLDIRAPFDGICDGELLYPGRSIKQGNMVVRVVSEKGIYVQCKLPQTEIRGIKVGNIAIVKSADGTIKSKGVVTGVSPVIEEDRSGRVIIKTDKKWRPGEVVKVEIEKEKFHNRVRVPVKSVLFRENRYLVFKIEDGRAKWQWIKKGVEGKNYIEVIDGVSPGDTVLTEGQFTIAHDAPVKVILE